MANHQHISKPNLKFAKSLSQKKVRSEESLFIVEGWRAIEDACAAGIPGAMFLYTPAAKDNQHHAAVFEAAAGMAKESYLVSDHELAAISETVTSQGVALILPHFEYDLSRLLNDEKRAKSKSIIVALDRISEPGNAGTIIRTADWFGAAMVILSEGCVELYNPKVIRSTMGSIFHIPVIESHPTSGENGRMSFIDVLRACRKAGFRLYGADVNASVDIQTHTWHEKSLIVIGNEAHGLSPDVSAELDACVTIPKFGKAESLNAGTAAAVFLGAIRLK